MTHIKTGTRLVIVVLIDQIIFLCMKWILDEHWIKPVHKYKDPPLLLLSLQEFAQSQVKLDIVNLKKNSYTSIFSSKICLHQFQHPIQIFLYCNFLNFPIKHQFLPFWRILWKKLWVKFTPLCSHWNWSYSSCLVQSQ